MLLLLDGVNAHQALTCVFCSTVVVSRSSIFAGFFFFPWNTMTVKQTVIFQTLIFDRNFPPNEQKQFSHC